jgi:hypothetical protein
LDFSFYGQTCPKIQKISTWDTHHFFETALRSRKDTFLRPPEKIEENRKVLVDEVQMPGMHNIPLNADYKGMLIVQGDWGGSD